MNHTAPDPFLDIATRGHRPRLGKEPRVLVSSTTVDKSTKLTLVEWMNLSGLKQGLLYDRLVSFAGTHNFAATLKK